MDKVIKTEHLEIKPYEDDDQNAMIELLTNKKIKENFMIPDFQTEKEAINMFKKLQAFSYSEEHYERGIYIDHKLIGFVNDVEIDDGVIELGYVIHPKHQNKGYASEMLKAVIDQLFQHGFHQVVAGAFENNAASIQVMRKCGMKKIAKEEDICYKGVLRHCYYYAVSKDDDKCELILNLEKLHTTELGIGRIKGNLSLDVDDVVEWCREKIQNPDASIIRKGKNWYANIDNCEITVNAYSYTIITAHRIKK